MSGTSLDGIDAVLIDWDRSDARIWRVAGHVHRPFDAALRAELLALNRSGEDELHRAALAANALARACAACCADLLGSTGRKAASIDALGAHGQTVRHRPGEFDGCGYTVQLLNGALLAELTGIDVVCDLRSRDVAAGGQGAPLVPAFHAAVFGAGHDRAVLNLGGIGNLSLLHADGRVGGFDCGPGNALLDLWCERHTGATYDAGGQWGARGQVLPALLAALKDEPFLRLPPPKSTGRDLFHAEWLTSRLRIADADTAGPQDVQATLAQFTAEAAVDALQMTLPGARDLLVCGGGALNGDLLARLQAALARHGGERAAAAVRPTDALGLPVMQVEAAAFAWLARAFLAGEPGNRPEVTGARGLRRLGCWHPAR
jgi:anhydro-N-acetylmuramic acid kinase